MAVNSSYVEQYLYSWSDFISNKNGCAYIQDCCYVFPVFCSSNMIIKFYDLYVTVLKTKLWWCVFIGKVALLWWGRYLKLVVNVSSSSTLADQSHCMKNYVVSSWVENSIKIKTNIKHNLICV
jgi:hypothetical protein